VDAPAALACSALKARYRETLASRCPQALFVHLAGSRELIQARLSARTDPYMRFWRAG
jgi:gluconate kinase